MEAPTRQLASLRAVSHQYGDVRALDRVDLDLREGELLGVIGPDGVGKSTLLGLVAGARRIQEGRVEVLGADLARARDRTAVCRRIAYMPQGLGSNLYPELSVRENLRFFAGLFGVGRREVRERIGTLLDATGLREASDRRARNLSGGMKQKLGLCCALIHEPDLLVLDEPTTGVDPLSRHGFWDLVAQLRRQNPRLGVVVATAYMEEAEPFDALMMLHEGRSLATGSASDLEATQGAATLEEAYASLLPARTRREISHRATSRPEAGDAEVAIEAVGLTRRFGRLLAVDSLSFQVRRGEIFGFVGPNGCGKTTTMKMVTGILPPTSGEAFLLGERVRAESLRQRLHVGYMSQSFSLYGDLSARENLRLYGRLFDLPSGLLEERIGSLSQRLGFAERLDQRAGGLPLGHRQRLGLAVATLHAPQVLVLDEPTSGVDPIAREEFWDLLADLAHGDGVTIFVSTHYLSEAARCDRVALMNAGRLLAYDTPAELVRAEGTDHLEEAFVARIQRDEARRREGGGTGGGP